MTRKKILVIGGGAGGYFAAIHAAMSNPNNEVAILEGSNKVLAKVLISGGGRCNVTHQCRKAEDLISYYPRGNECLLPAFQKFGCPETVKWFEQRGVPLKVEEDGRIFPVSDQSSSIANCLTRLAHELGIKLLMGHRMEGLRQDGGRWEVQAGGSVFDGDAVILATGSSTGVWKMLEEMGIEMVSAVPSLFTFNGTNALIHDLAGTSFPLARVSIPKLQISEEGPLLITHKGLSGPVILKISAWGARELNDQNHQFDLLVNWTGLDAGAVLMALKDQQRDQSKQYVMKHPMFGLTRRFWERLCTLCEVNENRNWAETGKKQMARMVDHLTRYPIAISGKSTFKEEFVTAGGIDMREIDVDTFRVKRFPGLYAVGEVLNVDAVTGGFNFQAAWTGGYLAGVNCGR